MRNAAERHDFFADLPVRRNADAVIVSSFDIEPAEVERLKHMHVPIVGINIPSTDGFDAGVSIDDYAATRSAIEHLIALGHRHIAFVGSAPTETNMRYSAEARLQGVIDAAAAHPGIELTPLSIQRGLGESNAALNAVLNASPSITAFCFEDDEMAAPVLYRLRQYGRRVPQDISIIGFDDSTLSAAVAAGGGYITAGARQVAMVFFTDLLISLIRQVLLPLLYACIAAAAADAVVPGHSLQKIGQGLRKCAAWALTALMLVFTGFLSVTGATTSAADALSTQLTRTAIATAVPVVGSIISDAAGTVLAGAGMLKGAIGVFGLLAVLAICLTPFITMAVQYLLYKLAAFLAGTVTQEPLADLIDALGSAFGLMLGMTGSCALALLISIISSVSVVST